MRAPASVALTSKRHGEVSYLLSVHHARWASFAIVFATVLAACGSGGDKAPNGTVDTQFLSKAKSMCGQVLNSITTPFPWESGWNPHMPNAAQMPAVGVYLDQLPTSHHATDLLHALGKPKSGRHSWATFSDLVAQQQGVVGEQITAAKAADKTAFVDTVDRISALSPKIDAAAGQVGFAKSSTCTQLFG